jgi:MOSC domain-containing protein YiiM
MTDLPSAPVLLSIQVSLPKAYGQPGADDWMDQPWQTGFYKEQVFGPQWLAQTNLAGDGQADLVNHGGPDKAVLAYAAAHYPRWRERLQRPDFPYGAFGENFTVDGLTEDTVCIGDIYRLGGALVQVSQPRQPCWKLARRWRIKTLAALVEQNGWTGWYLRVLEEGEVEAGQPMALLERLHPAWTVTRTTRTMRTRHQDHHAAGQLALIEELAISWRKHLAAAALDLDR